MTPTGGNEDPDVDPKNRANGALPSVSAGSRIEAGPPGAKRKVGARRKERIRVAVLNGLQNWKQTTELGQNPPAPVLTNHDALSFKPPPGILPPSVRQRLQGDVMPQVTPAMMRQATWE